jgi:heat-inducible transcriptional repressor
VEPEQIPAMAGLLNSHFCGVATEEMNRKLMALSDQLPPQTFLLLSQTVAYAVDVLDEAGQKEVFTPPAPVSCSSCRSSGTRTRPTT